MLEGAFSSPKIRRLAVILGVPWPHALGLAGLLWRFAAKHAQTGEVGRHDDEEIAAALEWPEDGTALVEALARCRLLDRVDGPARYIVHDWPDHAPRYVSAALKKKGLSFSVHYVVSVSDEPSVEQSADASTEPSADPSPFTSSPSPTSTPTNTLTPVVREYEEWRIPDDRLDQIFDAYVEGKRMGKGSSRAAIADGVRRYAVDRKCSIEVALSAALQQTEKDATAYKKLIESGEYTERFVPNAQSYFRRQRWLTDEDDLPEPTSKKEVSVDDEIRQARERRGS